MCRDIGRKPRCAPISAGKTSCAARRWRQPSTIRKNATERVFRDGLIESHPAARITRTPVVDRSDARRSRTVAQRKSSSAVAFFGLPEKGLAEQDVFPAPTRRAHANTDGDARTRTLTATLG